MGRKRKHVEQSANVAEDIENKEADNQRPKRTLLGWKNPPPSETDVDLNGDCKPRFRNKEKVLVICSRRIVYRYRHLMMDIVSLLPHCKKDNKIESKENKGGTLNELVELRNCTSCLFFECRKAKDLYLWMAKCPNGPSVKFLVNAVHTMEELKLTGNHLKGSRPFLTFSSEFDLLPHWQLLKEIMIQIFSTPKDHRKAKPFFDHVFVFSVVDNHIWFRNYQVGPRYCLNPIKIFSGSFTGQTLYENPFYVSPNELRAAEKKKKAGKYAKKIKAKDKRKKHKLRNPLEPDEFDDLWNE